MYAPQQIPENDQAIPRTQHSSWRSTCLYAAYMYRGLPDICNEL